MKLQMQGFDIDTYIATFDRLAIAAGWDLIAEGTIARFRDGLHKLIHSKALDRDNLPTTMDQWKAAARTEVTRAKEKHNAGLIPGRNRFFRPQNNYQNTPHRPAQQSGNSGIVPMDVDAAKVSNFKKLTPEERTQLAKEGRCFRCRLQGHMARECPKNNYTARSSDSTQTPPSSTTNTTTPTTTTVTKNKTPTLTRAQQIRALEEAMEEEEKTKYMDARFMEEDFWSAEA
jgi:hypothetical protein